MNSAPGAHALAHPGLLRLACSSPPFIEIVAADVDLDLGVLRKASRILEREHMLQPPQLAALTELIAAVERLCAASNSGAGVDAAGAQPVAGATGSGILATLAAELGSPRASGDSAALDGGVAGLAGARCGAA